MSEVLAKVNGVDITREEFEIMKRSLGKEILKKLQGDDAEDALLDEMINQKMIYFDAKDKKLDETEEFQKQLEILKENLLIQFGVNKIVEVEPITDEEKRAFYEEHKDVFVRSGEVEASHILVDDEALAREIYIKIDKGVPFEELAEKHSTCPSKTSGGSLGKFGRGQMVPEFESVAFALEENEVSIPVKTQFGYHVIRVDKKYPQQQIEFDLIEPEIEATLIEKKQHEQYVKAIEEFHQKYEVQKLK